MNNRQESGAHNSEYFKKLIPSLMGTDVKIVASIGLTASGQIASFSENSLTRKEFVYYLRHLADALENDGSVLNISPDV